MSETESYAPGQYDVIGARPLAQTVASAETIVTGPVTGVEETTVTVRVESVLKGTPVEGDEIAFVAPSRKLIVGDTGVWVLDSSSPPKLAAGGPNSVGLREVERALAGLSPEEDPPRAPEMRSQAAEAEAIAVVQETSADGLVASATVLEVLKGELPAVIDVAAGGPVNSPGGPWTFAISDTPVIAVLFLREEEGSWVAINSVNPDLYTPADVKAALD